MADLTAADFDLGLNERRATDVYQIENVEVLFHNALVGIDSNGYLDSWDDEAGMRFVGVFRDYEPAISSSGAVVAAGDTSHSPDIQGVVYQDGRKLRHVNVSGVSAISDLYKPVYCATDNYADLTLTPTNFVKPIGYVQAFYGADDQDVQLFTPWEYVTNGSQVSMVRHIDLALITGAADVVTTFTPGFRGRIVKWWAETVTPVTTAAKAVTLNVEIGTTNATGGTIALTSAALTPLGAIVAQAAAFTDGVAFTDTDTISIEAASVTAFVEGSINLVLMLEADE